MGGEFVVRINPAIRPLGREARDAQRVDPGERLLAHALPEFLPLDSHASVGGLVTRILRDRHIAPGRAEKSLDVGHGHAQLGGELRPFFALFGGEPLAHRRRALELLRDRPGINREGHLCPAGRENVAPRIVNIPAPGDDGDDVVTGILDLRQVVVAVQHVQLHQPGGKHPEANKDEAGDQTESNVGGESTGGHLLNAARLPG